MAIKDRSLEQIPLTIDQKVNNLFFRKVDHYSVERCETSMKEGCFSWLVLHSLKFNETQLFRPKLLASMK